MKRIIGICFFIAFFLTAYGQEKVKDALMEQGAWFLFSLRVEEKIDDKILTKVEFYKKDDVSSIFFDKDDKMYSVFSDVGSEMWEDLWKMVDDTHFVMVSPLDESTQVMDIIELDTKKLVFRNCSDIDGGMKCTTYTYFSTKEGWLPDSEIDELNTAGIMVVDKMINQ